MAVIERWPIWSRLIYIYRSL